MKLWNQKCRKEEKKKLISFNISVEFLDWVLISTRKRKKGRGKEAVHATAVWLLGNASLLRSRLA